ncbi:MAG: nicotinate-nucleotide diphosphorylase (carboxylating) [Nitrospirae bacterium CG2_30_70_394]|nr:MAG: nicotinate-nucleotide diphosphorylase (carboxylating) [Nitrospirae bacterium CG2_30_70_394]
MPPFDPAWLDSLLRRLLAEDVGSGDVTTAACIDPTATGTAVVVTREPATCAGVTVAARLFALVDPRLRTEPLAADGTRLAAGAPLLRISGPVAPLLTAERVALNLAQRLCGIATLTARFVAAVAGSHAAICDTRKTTPGLRLLEKYAVRCGGGVSHRFGLFDGVLIKDNHIKACGSVTAAVARARRHAGRGVAVEVEVEQLEEIDAALGAGADLLLLDNMAPATLAAAVEQIGGRGVTEASGGIDLATVAAVAATGVDFISVGALTHSPRAIDLTLELE